MQCNADAEMDHSRGRTYGFLIPLLGIRMQGTGHAPQSRIQTFETGAAGARESCQVRDKLLHQREAGPEKAPERDPGNLPPFSPLSPASRQFYWLLRPMNIQHWLQRLLC
jgi:hypothetical protein